MEFFAGANTYNGFYPIFDRVFENTERIFILKGSSGCGKSTLMKKIAKTAEEKGLKCHKIRCSADSNSLDAVIIPSLSTAVTDGTKPHSMDTTYPCVRESIVNFGEFLDPCVLMPQKDRIKELTDEKSLFYRRAYGYMSAAGKIQKVLDSIDENVFNAEKIRDYAQKFTKKFREDKGKTSEIFTSAFTQNGVETLPSFGNVKRVYKADKADGFSEKLLKAVCEEAEKEHINCIVSLSPLDADKTDAAFFPDASVLLCTSDTKPYAECEKVTGITGKRFIQGDRKEYSARKGIAKKLIKEILAEASIMLSQAYKLHESLENIYIRSMDYDALDRYSEKLILRIFGE